MDKYQDLRKAFARYEAEKTDFISQNLRLAEMFIDGLKSYLGLPDTYDHPESKKTLRYLRLYRLGEDGQNGEVEKIEEAVRHRNDGTFIFAFGVTLEQAPDKFPKHVVLFDLACEIEDGEAQFTILDKELTVAYDGDKTDLGKVLELVYDLIVHWLENWRIEEPRQKIGFHTVDD